jgi:hypothetical protein
MQLICCSCVLPKEEKWEKSEAVERAPLIAVEDSERVAEVKPGKPAAKAVSKEIFATVSSGLDIFKGVLCFLMIYSHVNLCLVNPQEVYYGKLGHFVGNAASGMCFLGFVFSYGYTCYWAYLSDWTPRPYSVRLNRVLRSAILPIIGAWVCSFAWSYMCFKIPITQESFVDILLFYYVWGNGPDFLISFTTLLLASFALRTPINYALSCDGTPRGRVRFAAGCVSLVVVPLLLTKLVVPDCTGNKRYFMFFLPCDKREPVGMANLPGLPHFFYFNLGVLAAVFIKYGADRFEKMTEQLSSVRQMLQAPIVSSLATGTLVLNVVLAILAYPLYTVWWTNYGNIAVSTPYGEILRGWSRGPSALWLIGNLWGIYTLLVLSLVLAALARQFWPLATVCKEMEHFGANVLINLVMSDCLLAGMYRGTSFPLTCVQGGMCTICIMMTGRFVHYLGASGRK